MKMDNFEEAIDALIADDVEQGYELRLFIKKLLSLELQQPSDQITFLKESHQKQIALLLRRINRKQLFDAIKKQKKLSTHALPALVGSTYVIRQGYDYEFWYFFKHFISLICLLHLHESNHDEKIDNLCRHLRLSLLEEDQRPILQVFIYLYRQYEDIASVSYALSEFIYKQNELQKLDPSKLDKKILNKLSHISYAYKVVANNKDKIIRTSKKVFQERLTVDVGDVDEKDKHSDLVLHDIAYDNKSAREKLEENREENRIADVLDNRFKTIEGTQQSAAQQHRKLMLSHQHIKRNQQDFSTNQRRLSAVSYQVIFSELWHAFHDLENTVNAQDKRMSQLLLLLSMLTSKSLDELTVDLSASMSKRKIIVFRDEQKTSIGYLVKIKIRSNQRLIDGHKLASETTFCLPLPPSFKEILTQKYDVTDFKKHLQIIKEVLKDIDEKYYISSITPKRLQACLRYISARYLGGYSIADVLTVADPRHNAALDYTVFRYRELRDSYKNFIEYIAKNVKTNNAGYFELKAFMRVLWGDTQQYNVGSQRTPSYELVTLMMQHKAALTESKHQNHKLTSEQAVYAAFNEYSLWFWQVFLLLTSIRPVEDAPGSLKEINLNLRNMWVSDKERYAKAAGRIIPICDFLHDAIVAYKAYLQHIIWTYPRDSNTQHILTDILLGERPLIHFFKQADNSHVLVPAKPSLLNNLLKDSFPLHLNWARHLGRSFLQGKVPSYVIDSVFGHEQPDNEAWHPYSAFMPSELAQVSKAYDALAQQIGLRQLNIEGVTQP